MSYGCFRALVGNAVHFAVTNVTKIERTLPKSSHNFRLSRRNCDEINQKLRNLEAG